LTAQRRNAARRRAISLAAVVGLIALTACGCSHSGPPSAEAAYGMHIDTNTPPGLRAKQFVDMLNSNWPIGPNAVHNLAAPEVADDIGVTMDTIWWDRPFTLTNVDVGAGHVTLQMLNSYRVAQTVSLRTDDNGQVDRYELTLREPTITKWSDIDAEIAKTGSRYSYQVSKVNNGRCEKVAGTNTDLSLPLASIMKLYVLLAVADGIKAGTVDWEDQLTITKRDKAVGSAGLDKMPPGSKVSVKKAAQQMISASDNMATDLLIARLGPGAVERALAAAGHHDPASMTPFPTMHELFSIGWGEPDLREQWKNGTKQDRIKLLALTHDRVYEPDPLRTHNPASDIGAEWYGSAADICRVHAALQAAAVGEAAPVKDILSVVPGIDLDKSKWDYIGAKAGNLPGDMTFSWYAVDHTGQPWVVSFQTNYPKFRSNTAASWLLSVAHGAFDLIPAG
jgi:beta-lactamase class A